jgi:hypothetical protein
LRRIAGILEIVGTLLGRELVEQATDCLPESVDGSFGGLSKEGFELGESLDELARPSYGYPISDPDH